MSYLKLRLRAYKLQKVRVKFGQFLRRRLIVYILCNVTQTLRRTLQFFGVYVNFDVR